SANVNLTSCELNAPKTVHTFANPTAASVKYGSLIIPRGKGATHAQNHWPHNRGVSLYLNHVSFCLSRRRARRKESRTTVGRSDEADAGHDEGNAARARA